jgi:hypothetical protein
MKINLIKSVEILSSKFTVIYEKDNNGGSFSWSDSTIRIGIKSFKKDPLYTFGIISHEIMEVILVGMGARFASARTGENYLFNFDHQTFENAIQIHMQAISKFIK